MRLSTAKIREKVIKVLNNRHFFQITALIFVLFITQASEAYKISSLNNNLSKTLGDRIVIRQESKEEFAEVDEIVGKVVARPVPSPEGDVEPSQAQTDESKTDKKNSDLCKSQTEHWKMIPDPDHSGQYIICNTETEKMTSVNELNDAQNTYRQKHGLNSLNINSELCKIAANRAVEVSKNFSHDGFESAVKGSGLGKSSYGENIASGPLTGVHFVEWSWDKSPGHRENMLGDWSDGCGGVSGKYAVFLFAK